MQVEQNNHFPLGEIISVIDNFNPIGQAFFKNQIKKKEIAHFFTGSVINTLVTDKWILSRTYSERWKQIFKYMIQCQIDSIDLDNNKQKFVLSQISHVKFCKLKTLNLFNNKICNIESLQFLQAPNLKKLNLIYNQINNLNPLKKCSFQLENLWIYSQYDIKVQNLNRQKSKFKQIGLQINRFNCVLIQNLSLIAELQTDENNIITLTTKTKKRIGQTKVTEMLRKKFNVYFAQLLDENIQQFDL